MQFQSLRCETLKLKSSTGTKLIGCNLSGLKRVVAAPGAVRGRRERRPVAEPDEDGDVFVVARSSSVAGQATRGRAAVAVLWKRGASTKRRKRHSH